jgi:hypothetical protein
MERIMKYTINGKEYTEFDINLAIAEINILSLDMSEAMDRVVAIQMRRKLPNYCTNPVDTWHIIEKCWDELMCVNDVILGGGVYSSNTEWDEIIDKHSCTKLVAACICFIEINEAKQ